MVRIIQRAGALLFLALILVAGTVSPVYACSGQVQGDKSEHGHAYKNTNKENKSNNASKDNDLPNDQKIPEDNITKSDNRRTEASVVKEAVRPQATPGNNGTIKVHEKDTPNATENNDPKVCVFNIEGFWFDAGQSGYLRFYTQGNDAPYGAAPSNMYTFGPTNADGYAASAYFNATKSASIPSGHYKVVLYGKDIAGNVDLSNVKAKSKVFKVSCEAGATGSAQTEPQTPSQGHVLDEAASTTVPSSQPTVLGAATGTLENTGSNLLLPGVIAMIIVAAAAVVFCMDPAHKITKQELIELVAL